MVMKTLKKMTNIAVQRCINGLDIQAADATLPSRPAGKPLPIRAVKAEQMMGNCWREKTHSRVMSNCWREKTHSRVMRGRAGYREGRQ